MTPSFAPQRPPSASDPDLELDGFVAAFESAVAADPAVDPAGFLPSSDHPLYMAALSEVVRVDLEFAWGRGEERRVEYYRERFPALFTHPQLLREVVREEMRLRAAAGEVPDESEFDRRFGSNRTGSGEPPVPVAEGDHFPNAGDTVAGFTLTTELGRGAFGRVFLARQADLADRPVAVKVSAKFPGEWQTLARLQHTNIVPVYSVHRHGRFHVACMPYLGRTTLADLICDLRANGAVPASGRAVASTLHDRAAHTSALLSGGEPTTPLAPPPPEFPPAVRERYERSSFPEWVVWLGAELADGLAHAHDRGILHRDVKPANVLLTDDGRPTLLDFNLSDDQAERRDRWQFVGGTLRYMAPEHLAALCDDGLAKPDARSDVFSLGLILYELLTGRLPYDDPAGCRAGAAALMRAARASTPADVRTFKPDVTPAIASILRTALDPDPARRYQSAADLRDDLRRQLDHLPLKVAPDRSPAERFRKWRRRHPRLTSWVTVSALAAVVLTGLGFAFVTRQQHYRSEAAANHLYRLADVRGEVRATLSTAGGPRAEYAEAAEKCRSFLDPLPAPTDPRWNAHDLIRPLGADDRRRATELVTELRAWQMFAEQLAVGRVNRAELAAVMRAANDPDGPFSTPASESARPRTAATQMLPALRAAARTQSSRWEYWYRLGQCEQLAGDLSAARTHFTLAASLADTNPWPLYHLGVAALEAKDPKAAIAAFDRCLDHRGDVPEVYLNRAIARIELGNYGEAIADLDRIEPHADKLPRLYFVREEARRRCGDAMGADADRAAGLKLEPTDALGWNARGLARLAATPPDAAGAVADFDRAIAADPDLWLAYQNKANVLAEHLNRPADALKVLDTAVDSFPDHPLSRAGRAVLLARAGKADAARRDADQVLLTEPPAVVCYQVACVYLLTATSDADRTKGLSLLRRTLRLDPTWAAVMPTDPDLKSVWASADFKKLIAAAAELAQPSGAPR